MINASFQPDDARAEEAAAPPPPASDVFKISNGGGGYKGCWDYTPQLRGHVASEPVEKPKTKYAVTKGYDPYDFGNLESASSLWTIVAQIIVISFGPTLLSIPASFVSVGYVTGFVVTCLTVFLYAHCMRVVLATEYELCKRNSTPSMSYIGMTREAFSCGPEYLRWCSTYTEGIVYAVFLFIWAGGNAIVFLLASQNLKDSYDFFFHTDVDVRLIMVYLVIPLTALCWIPDLKLLLPLSFFTNVVNIVSICVIAYYAVQDLPEMGSRQMAANPRNLPLFVGLLLFTINATGLMIPLKNEMKHPKKFNSKYGVITVSYASVSVMYSIFGMLCYLKWGANVNSSVIRNIPHTDFNKILIGLYGIGNCCFYPLVSYVSFDIIWNNLLKDKFEKSEYTLHYEYVCRTVIALSSMIFAYVVPNLEVFLSLTGTVGTSIDSLIIPALAETLIYHQDRRYWLFLKNGAIIALGVVLIVMGSIDCIGQIIDLFR